MGSFILKVMENMRTEFSVFTIENILFGKRHSSILRYPILVLSCSIGLEILQKISAAPTQQYSGLEGNVMHVGESGIGRQEHQLEYSSDLHSLPNRASIPANAGDPYRNENFDNS